MKRSLYMLLAILTLGVVGMVGCAQNTEAANPQPTRQVQSADTEQAAQGGKYTFNQYIINTTKDVPGESGVALALDDPAQSQVDGVSSDGAGNNTKRIRSGYTIAGVTNNITIGGSSTGPQSGGTASGQSSAPSASITQSPTQEPKATVNVPIALGAPGSAPQATGAASLEGPASTTASQQNELRTLYAKWKAGQASGSEITRLNELATQLFGGPIAPVPAPSTQPSGGQ